MTNKKDLSERDICTMFITPALERAGWDMKKQVREEVGFTDGRIYVKGNLTTRGKRKRADYILYYKPNIPVAVIEAKDNKHSVMAGIQQGLDYATILDIPSVFSSNGDSFYEHDRTASSGKVESEFPLHQFPSPEELWQRYKRYKGIENPEAERISAQDYFFDGTGRSPRYYQQIAINRTVEAIAKGQQRILLTMATGTGKTYTAFQIIHRLWKAGAKKRILFLADRNALIDQTRRGDFRHFKDKMTVIKQKKIDKSYEIYLALYQGLTNYDEDKDAYREFSRDFFDLIVIDECHRGSASEDSAWREILAYFHAATHIGLTATPKETEVVSSTEYFGDPIYTYSLKQGIQDGFLAPYKVLRVGLNVDLEGWRPEAGKTDKNGRVVDDRIYNRKDYDKYLVIDERTQTVANKITEYLSKTNRFDKTIVFCVDIEHAQRMRAALANANSDLMSQNPKYIMQITGDNEEGKRELDNFINPEETYPVIAITSKLMTTGVDAQTCKLIVLDSNIGSMTEFKQIIGRGTRINEEYGKTFFTILDFRNVTDLFADSDFDGDPVRVKELREEDEFEAPKDELAEGKTITDDEGEEIIFDPPIKSPAIIDGGDIISEASHKFYVNGVNVAVLNERIQYMDSNGKLITGSLKDYTRQKVCEQYQTLDDFLNKWHRADKKQAIIDELAEQGIVLENLKAATGKEMDIFDLICHAAFDQPPLTRAERAKQAQKRDVFTQYGEGARKVLEALLDKYADEGIENLEDIKILKVTPFDQFGTPTEIIQLFGGKQQYIQALIQLEHAIYQAA
ncbi:MULTISPECIES: EcoAI/FtnUII family type I restriction enzme subunit R [Enterobacteriaceae]|uniref:Restriction endonuclease n=2 Tax=Enterobacteriaceae TaxID=543 RepID=A0A9X7Q5X9_9ENTR|nr:MULTISPECIES: DEAD/DEAH box helicase family protein [Enterobacteriaceae]MCU3020510.1 DEAD/DEAH box helicase family protein [Enterobacter hormaechei subsp. hoffmannii]HAT3944706.1 DEAD/DEAH box helicase family protein [Kluyvera ascorbata]HCJ7418368.1 DEAD/DEAH box helicase family protein [Enterobacter hormaechei subsp. xiangfangensis]MBH0126393.1 DEAD/DEAH box helicase family protein [Enterobacter sp. SECR18-0236]MBZ7338409.1 DEAD/DEAH box helicase [Klebsiella grimontii]